MYEDFSHSYRLPITLEKHFENLCVQNPAVRELHSIYELTKKRLEQELTDTHNAFFSFSYHDASHSRTIIQAIERFLGEKRIVQLSATDTFMLLICAYAHDYGMVQTYNKIVRILQSDEFTRYLESLEEDLNYLDNDDRELIKKLLLYLHDKKSHLDLDVFYRSVMTILQLYLRPNHWRGVSSLASEYEGLFDPHLKIRFINGVEGIVDICMCHGKTFDHVMKLRQEANGFAGDYYHPRFVAAMLRLGDLLDLDNNRFPTWFMKEINAHTGMISKSSEMHARKHQSITHILITEKVIEIDADCTADAEGFSAANLVNEWTGWIKEECQNLVLNWNEIAQPDFGRPPSRVDINLRVDGSPYETYYKNLKMQMSQERVMKLLEGFSIYNDKYVGIRELVQNAVDASLLQLWKDIRDNRYVSIGLSKDTAAGGIQFLDLLKEKRYSVFGNYDITVEAIKDLQLGKVIITVKDKGIGISKDEVQFISDIGSSRENNPRRKEIMEDMPDWLKPSGIYGIGLQSVFQITDCIEFYTRQPNQPERKVALYSFGRSKGKIEILDLPPNKDGKMFFDNAIPGTNAKIFINPDKIIDRRNKEEPQYYDMEFDSGSQLDFLYAEICSICKDRLKSVKRDYFNIIYKEMTINEDGKPLVTFERILRWTYFVGTNDQRKDRNSIDFKDTISLYHDIAKSTDSEFYYDSNNTVYYWDDANYRVYTLKVRPCRIKIHDDKLRVYLPDPTPDIYKVSYKFNSISNTESIYTYRNRTRKHAGFLSWNIQILDADPIKYMNIDRSRLKDGAITEDELLEVRKVILEKWCRRFIDDRKGKSVPYTIPEGSLISLIILFYQNVSDKLFQEFIHIYGNTLDMNKYVIGKEDIPLSDLWNQEVLFFTEYPLPDKINNICQDSSEEKTASRISNETLLHFPHRLIQIISIKHKFMDKYQYYFKFVAPSDKKTSVEMTDLARFMDYALAFDLYDDTLNIKYESIQKKVFKPDRLYPSLIIDCYPNSFTKGMNMSSHIDACIHSYILSPFDTDSSKMIRDYLRSENEAPDKILALESAVVESEQYKKCVNYILKKKAISDVHEKSQRETIEAEYKKFIKHFCSILKKTTDDLHSILKQVHSNKDDTEV